MSKFLDGYIECALWASLDDNDEPLDESSAVLSDDCHATMARECEAFERENRALLDEAIDDYHRPDEYLGYDFWLTRNHHGTGFWDRGFSQDLGSKLTNAAHKCGERSLYIGDDNQINQYEG